MTASQNFTQKLYEAGVAADSERRRRGAAGGATPPPNDDEVVDAEIVDDERVGVSPMSRPRRSGRCRRPELRR